MTVRLAALALVAMCVGAGSVSAAAPADQTAVRSVLLRQAQLLKQARWRAMYATYTPRFRRNCPYARFVAGAGETRRLLGPRFALRQIQVRLETPRRAIVAYTFVRDGRAIARVTLRHRDVYAKVGTRWLDELDRVSSC